MRGGAASLPQPKIEMCVCVAVVVVELTRCCRPAAAAAATPLFAVCLATVVSVGLLLCRQLRLLVAGSTYLARLAAAQHQQYGGPPPPPPRLDMRRVLGSNALTWLLPAWGPPLVGTKAS